MSARCQVPRSHRTQVLPHLNIVTAFVILASGCSPDALEPDRSATATVSISSTTYYVSITSGDDGRSCIEAQNIDTPKRTLNDVISDGCLTAGSTLLIRGGTYEEALVNNIPSGTSWAEPVTLKAFPGEPVTLRPPPGGSYVLHFQDGQSYIVIDGLIVDAINVSTDAVKITYGSDPTTAAHHIRIMNGEIRNAEVQGVLVSGPNTSHNEFINLKIHQNGTSSQFHHGIYIEGPNNVVDRCDVYSNAAYGIHVYAENGGANYNTVRNNKSHGNNRGMVIAKGDGNLAYNNLVYGNTDEGLNVDYGVSNARIFNNTLYGNRTGIYIGSGSTDATVRNNLVWQSGTAYTNIGSGTTADHNLWGTDDPRFVNAAAGDFHLQSGSPAIDTGATIPEVTTDFDGVPRPQGAAYDIGAYEAPATPGASPVASWSFDEGSGQTAADASGNGNTATLGSTTGAEPSDPLWVPGHISNALQYDGSSSRTTVAGSPTINNLAAFTYVAWVYPTASPTFPGRVFSKETSATFDEFYFIATTNLEAVLYNTAGAEFLSRVAPVPLNAWSHIAVTYNDAGDRKLHLFLNGSEVSYINGRQDVVTGTLRTTANTLIIGNRIGGDRAFQGKIDEGKVYDRALSAAEIQSLYNSGNFGPAASWSFDEGSGQTAADASGNGNTATLGSTTAAEPSDPLWVPGRISNALQYDGSSSRTTVAGSPTINNLAAFTYVAWVHPTASPTFPGRVFSKETSTTFDEFYFIATTNLEAVLYNTAGAEFLSRVAPVPLNAWSHIAVTYNDAGDRKLHLFLNGSEVSYINGRQDVITGTLRTTANTLIIGNRIGGDRAFQGKIDEGKVYDRALSAAEIQSLFNAGNPAPSASRIGQ